LSPSIMISWCAALQGYSKHFSMIQQNPKNL